MMPRMTIEEVIADLAGLEHDGRSFADVLAEHHNWARCVGTDGVYQCNLSPTDDYGWEIVTQDQIDDALTAYSDGTS